MEPFAPMLTFITTAAAPVPGAEGSGTLSGLITYITLALALSFLCSVLEAILLSASPSYIETLVQEGSSAGKLMSTHKENVELPISAILTLNTIAHTVGAAGAGAEATALFGSEYFGLISAVLTFLILVFSEIIPKTIGAMYWRPLLPFAAYAIRLLVWVLYPIVWFLQWTTRIFQRDENTPTVTRHEIAAMASLGADEGSINESETRVLRNLLQLNRVHVYDIMTPRTVVLMLQEKLTIGDVMQRQRVLPFSRIPIYGDSLDDVTGFVLRHDILSRAAHDEDNICLCDIKRDLHPIPAGVTVTDALNELVKRQQHIFLVIDEYGGMAGVLTMEDAFESLLGAEITDESDLVADMRKMAQERYQKTQGLLNSLGVTAPASPAPAPDEGKTSSDV